MGKKNQKQDAVDLAQEIKEWEDYLLADLRERVENSKNGVLSERKLKKTSNGDATYERLVRVIGRGNPERLRKEVVKIEQEVREERKNSKSLKKGENFEKSEPFELEQSIEEVKRFEPEESFEPARHFEKDETSREVSQLAEKPKRRKWDKMSLLVFLQEKCQELGRVPTSKEVATWSKAKLCPSYPTCMKLLEAQSKADWVKILLGGEECA